MDKYNSPFPVPNTMLTKVSSISEKIGEIKIKANGSVAKGQKRLFEIVKK